MAQPQIDVIDALAAIVTVNTINPNGRAAAADSLSATFCTEDKTVLDAIATKLASIDSKLT